MERAGGHWDLPVLNTCLQLLSPGQVFYDIGANVGYMAIEAASRLGDKIRTYAFEPQPELARNVAISAALNGLKNVQVFTAMLGREPGEATLFIPSHSIHASAVSAEAGATAISCPMTTIDELVQGGVMAPPDVIKIDVEGAERDVFEGARRTLTQHRSAIVFESDRNAERFGYTRRQLCDLLRQMADYVFYDIPQLAGDHAKPRAMEEAMFDDDHFNRDLLALPSGRTLRDQVG
jgi:FkbM family methyltransferase